MKLQQHIAHPHALVFNEGRINQGEDTFHCSGCGEEVLGPCFSCADHCGFYLHKKCAEAPIEIDDHPFHRHHPLILSLMPLRLPRGNVASCTFCDIRGERFMYYCSSCDFYLDINCALLTRDTAGNFIDILSSAHSHSLSSAHPHSLILLSDDFLKYYRFCSRCFDAIADASYACFACQFFVHKKCLELPPEINHPYHRKHQLILHIDSNSRACNLCETEHRGPFYRCSVCNVHIHSKCAFPPPIIEDKRHHEHPFTLLLRPDPFTCDACGNQGKKISYTCSACNIQVHQKCISLPRFIGINLHHHPLYRNFFLRLKKYDSKTWDCQICFYKMNMEHASYYCTRPDCNFQVHVNCVKGGGYSYDLTEFEDEDQAEKHYEKLAVFYENSKDCIIRVIKEINVGEDVIAAEILHISHGHNLTFSNDKKDNKNCDGCILPILSPFYYCSQCDFFLHKTCAELSSKKLLWYDKRPVTLRTNCIFKCSVCRYECSGFCYELEDEGDPDDGTDVCLRCATISHSFTYLALEPHHLLFDYKYKGQCSACGSDKNVIFRTKECDFALDTRCLTLPHIVWHKCDKHFLILNYRYYDDHSLQHYCDICEERRDPTHWFYHCEACDTVVHPKCVLGRNPFIKPGSNYTDKNHPHPLIFVQKIYYYPQCVHCGKPCQDLSLKCLEHGCNYIVHWKCIKPIYFLSTSIERFSDNDSD